MLTGHLRKAVPYFSWNIISTKIYQEKLLFLNIVESSRHSWPFVKLSPDKGIKNTHESPDFIIIITAIIIIIITITPVMAVIMPFHSDLIAWLREGLLTIGKREHLTCYEKQKATAPVGQTRAFSCFKAFPEIKKVICSREYTQFYFAGVFFILSEENF